MSRDQDWGWFAEGAVIGEEYKNKITPDCSDKPGHAPLCGRCTFARLARKMIQEHERTHHQIELCPSADDLPFDEGAQ